MNTTSIVFAIIGSAFGIMVTFIGATWHVSNRFGKVEGRLTAIETILDIKRKARD